MTNVERRKLATTHFRRLITYIFTDGFSSALYAIVQSPYALVKVADNDVVWAAQLYATYSTLLYIARLTVGNFVMGGFADRVGRRTGFVVAQGSYTLSMILFILFPNVVTYLGGSVLQGIFTAEPVTQSFLGELTTVFTLTDGDAKGQVQPTESAEGKGDEDDAAFRNKFAKKSAKLVALVLATYTFSLAIGAVVASEGLIGDANDSNTTSSSEVNATTSLCEEAAATNTDTSYMNLTFTWAIALSLVCWLVTWTLAGHSVREKLMQGQISKEKFDFVKSWISSYTFLRDRMLSVPYVRMMCFMLFIMKLLEYGSLALFFFYGKFQFDWTAQEYGIFIFVIVIMNAFANTVTVNVFNKVREEKVGIVCKLVKLNDFGVLLIVIYSPLLIITSSPLTAADFFQPLGRWNRVYDLFGT